MSTPASLAAAVTAVSRASMRSSIGETRNTRCTPSSVAGSVSGWSMSATTSSAPADRRSAALAGSRTSARTGCPASRRPRAMRPPNMPVAPVTRIMAAQSSLLPMAIADHDVALVRADNPSPFTLEGTNTWVVGREPAWVVDPGPLLDDHVAAVVEEVMRRGGIEGIVLTHDHADHAEATHALRLRAAEAWKRGRYGEGARGRANLVPVFGARG